MMSQASHADRMLPIRSNSFRYRCSVLAAHFEQLIRKLAMRNGMAELRAMGDRQLADIGLTRQQVEYVDRHGRWPTVDQ